MAVVLSQMSSTPAAIIMPKGNHFAANSLFKSWYDDQKQRMGGVFDWTRVGEGDMRAFAVRQMDAASVPQPTRDLYWERYNAMMQRLRSDGH